MPKGSEKLTNARKDEIINACEKLYQTMNFKDITIKEIGNATSFTRTSVYNYFRTKEEIFLALMQREYELWTGALRTLREGNDTMSRADFAHELAFSLTQRGTLLKLLSMNHYDMEEHSRMERLVEFKVAYGNALEEVRACLEHFFSDMTEGDIRDFVYSFFPFMFGIYPYTSVTDKQREAMKLAGVKYTFPTAYEITLAEVKRLLGI